MDYIWQHFKNRSLFSLQLYKAVLSRSWLTLGFCFLLKCSLLLFNNVQRRAEVLFDSITEIELGDTAADIQQRRQERQARGGSCRKRPRTKKSDTKTEPGGEAGPSQSRYNKGHTGDS